MWNIRADCRLVFDLELAIQEGNRLNLYASAVVHFFDGDDGAGGEDGDSGEKSSVDIVYFGPVRDVPNVDGALHDVG